MSRNTSLARRFVLIFGLGTPLTLILLGTCLAIMLKFELERRDMTELDGKSEVVQHLLTELRSPNEIVQQLRRIQDVGIGHDALQLGVKSNNQWLLRPNALLAGYIDDKGIERLPGLDSREALVLGGQFWWVRQLKYQVPGTSGPPLYALIAVDVSDARTLSARFNMALGLVGLTGAILMGVLAWWGTRRALAPLDIVAAKAEQVTAHGLGSPLAISDAPVEVHGLVLSINHMLERLGHSFEALQQFGSDIAHELRTPLNALKLQTEVTLSRDRSPTEYREALHQSLVEINRLERMVDSMLFIARADRGMRTAVLKNVCLEDALRDTIEYFKIAASEREQSIEYSGWLHASCDQSMIRRAVTNLLSNATRYAPENAKISVQLKATGEDAIIRVTNPSRSYSNEELEHLFTRFARHGAEVHPAGNGLGLGLAIVRSIMQMHAGKATAQPVPGGVMFELRWPSAFAGLPTEAGKAA